MGHTVFGQKDYVFKRYSTDQGISNNFISDIIQDKYGFIWLATASGLNRFNGLNFEKLETVHQDSAATIGRVINCLELDYALQLWVGTENGLFSFDYPSKVFSHFPLPDQRSAAVQAIGFASEHSLWIGTGHGLYHIDLQSGQYQHYLSADSANALVNNNILSLLIDSRGWVWAGTDQGLSVFDPQKQNFKHIAMDRQYPGRGIVGNFVRKIIEDKQGNIWIGAAGLNSGISCYNSQTGGFSHYQNIAGEDQSLINNGVFALAFDDEGRLWAGTDEGLDVIDIENNSFSHIKHDPSKSTSLTLDIVKSIFKDKDGRMWVGTFGGLNLWDKNANAFHMVGTGPSYSKNLIHGYVKCFANSSMGGFWIGMDGGGYSFSGQKQENLNTINAKVPLPTNRPAIKYWRSAKSLAKVCGSVIGMQGSTFMILKRAHTIISDPIHLIRHPSTIPIFSIF
ncbi:MAG: hypothetical protein HC819_12200 [Cyclobacteriaceae bacterium]|nr:hypothetical protein [Cyclobacteriaceae bacterium]